MKALQQAAQNRSGRPPTGGEGAERPATGDEGAERPATRDEGTERPATHAEGTRTPATHADPSVPGPGRSAPAEIDLVELSLEPIVERPAALRAPSAGGGSADTGNPARAPGAQRTERFQPAAASPPGARAAGGGPADRRSAPRWSGDLQDGARAHDSETAATGTRAARNGEHPRRRGQDRPDTSPARAGAVLAAGAGAARAGALSRVTRMQWIIAGGALAGVLLFAYFYVQISYPGLLQRGFRQPALTTPLANRQAPPSVPTTPSASGTLDTIGNAPPASPIAGSPAGLPATAPGGDAPPPPVPGTTAASAPAGVPAALAASPLLNPPPGGAAAGPAAASTPTTQVVANPKAIATAAPNTAAGPATTAPAPATAMAMATAAAAAAAQSGIAAPSAPAPSTPATAPAAQAAPANAAASGMQRPATASYRPPATPASGSDGIRVTRGSAASPVNPALADAYDHLQAGRIESAQRLYEQVAAADPRNIDALLGMGAVAQLGNQVEVASRLYMRVLEIEPRNAHAQAALIGQLGRADPVAAESQLKTLIAREPSPFLFFTLGNLYADQNRWAQAQQAYFQAHHLQPGNADYAFNLAVGLERIAQPRLAIEYLRTAIRLAEAGARANFDIAAARKRVALLESSNRAP